MRTSDNTAAAYDYESDWRRYTFPGSEAEFASDARVRRTFARYELGKRGGGIGGIPLACNGRTAYINDSIEHTLIFGETGSGKSYSLIMPMIPILAESQSMFVTDIKGELSADPKIRGYLESVGCKCVYLDFREFNKDSYNILQYPFELYRSGKKDKAMATLTSFIRTLATPFENSKSADPYWHLSAEEFMLPVLQILFEVCASRPDYYKYVNMLSLASFCNENGTDALKSILRNHIKTNNNATEMLKGVLAAPEKTLSCIVSTVASFLRDFVVQDSLLRMLSSSSFDVRRMYREKTCVFLILPDETDSYNAISGLLIDFFYHQLIDEFSAKYQHEPPKHCISMVIDEFCNVCINGMNSKISASRGRMIRWFLVCQSKQQLDTVYEKDAPTIIGNCKNILFLQSSDPEMLNYISHLLGTTNITHSGQPEPLMSAEKLKSLPRTPDYRQAIFMRDDLKYKVNLPGFDKYTYLNDTIAASVEIPAGNMPAPEAYTPAMLREDLNSGKVPVPFKKRDIEPPVRRSVRKRSVTQTDDDDIKKIEDEIERKFAELFGELDDDDDD